MNMAVEFHDSQLNSVRWEGEGVVLELTVYVHSSAGSPGVAPGEGWQQDAEIRIESARVEHLPAGPLWIFGGSVEIVGETFHDVLPLPFDRLGPMSLRLSGAEGVFTAAGNRMRLTPIRK